MKSKSYTSVLLVLFFLGFSLNLYSQPKLKSNPENLINGKLWTPLHTITKKHQFFLNDLSLKGKLNYHGQQFDHVKFFYDISTGEVITPISTENKTSRNIVVNPSYLEGFTIEKNKQLYQFVRGDLLHGNLAPSNYYQIFKSRSVSYLINHNKLRSLSFNGRNENFDYIDNTKLYVIIDTDLHEINSKKDLLNFFLEKKKEMKQFIRFNKLKIRRKNPYDAILLLMKFDQ